MSISRKNSEGGFFLKMTEKKARFFSNRRNGVRVSENPKIFETFFKFFFGPKSSKKEFGEVWDQSEHYSKSYFFHTEGRFFFIREISLFLKKDLAKNDLYLELRFSVSK